MGVVRAQHRTDGIGRFAVGVLRVIAALVHRVQNTAVHRLEAVTHIGQSTRHDNRHRVVQERRLDFLFHIAHNDLGTGPRHHDDVFFHCITLINLSFCELNASLFSTYCFFHPKPTVTDFGQYTAIFLQNRAGCG